jgi:hypothetical protein
MESGNQINNPDIRSPCSHKLSNYLLCRTTPFFRRKDAHSSLKVISTNSIIGEPHIWQFSKNNRSGLENFFICFLAQSLHIVACLHGSWNKEALFLLQKQQN